MALAQRFLRGSALNLSDQVLRFAAVFVMTPVMVGILGQEQYGLWVLLMSIVGHYSLLDFGLSFSISRFFSRAIGAKDDDDLSVLVSTALAMMTKVGLTALGITAVAVAIVPFFGMESDTTFLVRAIILTYGVFLAVGFPVRVFRSLLKSHLRYDLLVMASVFQILIGNVSIYWFLTHGHGLMTLALVNVGAGFLEYGIVVWAARRSFSEGFTVNRSKVDRARSKEILKYSVVAFVTQLGNSLRSKIDPIIISSVIGFSSVTLYAVGTRFPIYLTDVVGAVLGGQLLAIFSQSQGKTGTIDDSTNQFIMATRLSTVIALFCGSSMIFYGGDFIERWMGEGFETSAKILMILTIPYIFSLMQYPSLSYIYSLAKHRYLAIITLSAGAVNLILSLILVQFWGIYGVVWATFIEMLAVYLIVFPLMICRVSGISRKRYYLEALARPFGTSLLILTPFYFFAESFLEADYGRMSLLGFLQLAYFGPLAYFFVLSGKERGLLASALKRDQ